MKIDNVDVDSAVTHARQLLVAERDISPALKSALEMILLLVTVLLSGESLFLRKLVLGIPAQASGKNLTRPLMPSAPQTSCVRATSPLPS
ncbi:hypothetical protein [Bathymodiolus platifrons methanotrophic gill symbiont]|uniref:hypothetical protein n=1 Tax=Bathymodiolus platifrons methanotrophic gill symbiont TaxID=113268 RepID=UPI001C8E91AC|nr:hypothetical protein [Bathymodiolus platifrons methanotrophic gill symbiont]